MSDSSNCIVADDSYIIDATQIRFVENGEDGISIWFSDTAEDEAWTLTYENTEQQQAMYDKIRQAMLASVS